MIIDRDCCQTCLQVELSCAHIFVRARFKAKIMYTLHTLTHTHTHTHTHTYTHIHTHTHVHTHTHIYTQDEYIPWGTLRYLIGEAMYGGRVSDSFDRRILTTYLDEYMGDFLFDTFQPFSFFQHKDVNIAVPPAGGLLKASALSCGFAASALWNVVTFNLFFCCCKMKTQGHYPQNLLPLIHKQ